MNFLKRGACSLWHRKKNFILLFIVFLILSVLILAGFSITVACRFAEESLRKSIGASVMVNNYHVDSGDIYYGADLIPNEQVQEIAKHPLVTDYNPFVYSMAVASQDVSPIVTELQEEVIIRDFKNVLECNQLAHSNVILANLNLRITATSSRTTTKLQLFNYFWLCHVRSNPKFSKHSS